MSFAVLSDGKPQNIGDKLPEDYSAKVVFQHSTGTSMNVS
jgi:hypothetical protein